MSPEPSGDHARPLKVTVRADGSFDHASGVAGVGLIVHETRRPEGGRQGEVVARLAEAYLDVPSGQADELAILRALEVALTRDALLVRVRAHDNQLRRRLKEDQRSGRGLERQDLHGRILRLALAFREVQFSHQPRRKNQDARKLARAARSLSPIAYAARQRWSTGEGPVQ